MNDNVRAVCVCYAIFYMDEIRDDDDDGTRLVLNCEVLYFTNTFNLSCLSFLPFVIKW